MPRRLPKYPDSGPWSESSIRVPDWIREALVLRAQAIGAEPWVLLMDGLIRSGSIANAIPPFHDAVLARYAFVMQPDGTLSKVAIDRLLASARSPKKRSPKKRGRGV